MNQSTNQTLSTDQDRPIRVIIGKIGLDGHTRGAKTLARTFSDNGMEVIYTGMRKTPEEITVMAIQEDVDVVGISSLGGSHMTHIPELITELEERGVKDDVLLVLGGVIPKADRQELLDHGVDRIYPPDSDIAEIIDYIEANA